MLIYLYEWMNICMFVWKKHNLFVWMQTGSQRSEGRTCSATLVSKFSGYRWEVRRWGRLYRGRQPLKMNWIVGYHGDESTYNCLTICRRTRHYNLNDFKLFMKNWKIKEARRKSSTRIDWKPGKSDCNVWLKVDSVRQSTMLNSVVGPR